MQCNWCQSMSAHAWTRKLFDAERLDLSQIMKFYWSKKNHNSQMQPKIAFAACASGGKVVVIREWVQRPIRFQIPVVLKKAFVLRWAHLMLNVFCSSVGAPHVILSWQHLMSRWARLLSFGRPFLCYFEHVFFYFGRRTSC